MFSFSTFLKDISGYFDRRFFLSAFFPVLAFAGLSLGMSLSLWGPQTLVELWRKQPVELQAVITVGSLCAILFIAYLFHIFQTVLTRLYEGYWRGNLLANWWGRIRQRYYQEIWDYTNFEIERRLGIITQMDARSSQTITPEQTAHKQEIEQLHKEIAALEDEQWRHYSLPPKRSLVMPTQLGNILRSAEYYATSRYALDASVAWPRLQSLLPRDFAEGLRDEKAFMDSWLVVTTLAGVFALGWEIGLGLYTARWDLFFLASFGWVLALLSYSGALQAARSYGELIKAAFDLHRWELIKALHLKMPTSYKNERRLWEEVSYLLYRNYPPAPEVFRYESEEARPAPPSLHGLVKRLLTSLAHFFGQDRESGAKR